VGICDVHSGFELESVKKYNGNKNRRIRKVASNAPFEGATLSKPPAYGRYSDCRSYHVLFIAEFVSPPLQVVRDGQLLRRNMRREFLTKEELTHQLRRQGVEELKDVRAAYVESDDSITVISDKGNK
jgi:hypothetical protein